MTYITKQTLVIIFLFFFNLSFSQTEKNDSLRGAFTYLLQYKPNSLNKENIIKELFSLQISDNRSFFISENKLKFDSLITAEINKNSNTIDLRNAPASGSNFLIIQTNENLQIYEKVGMTLLSYSSPVINNWKLIDETKTINSITCKKAEVSYKGRDWIAWYAKDIPFPYGPHKFSGLPGLIVKMTDKTGDYDFELVKSVSNTNLKGKMITMNKSHYQNAKVITKKELSEARKNFRENAKRELESMDTIFSDGQNKQKVNKANADKKGYNPIELED